MEVILRCGWRGALEGRERTEEEDGGGSLLGFRMDGWGGGRRGR